MQNLVKFLQFVPNILSENKIQTLIKGHNSVKNLRKLMCNNPNIDLVNINAKAKFGQIPSIYSQYIERKLNSASIKGHNSVFNFCKLTCTCNNPKLDVGNSNAHAKFGQIPLIRIVLKILSGNEIFKSIEGINTVKTL